MQKTVIQLSQLGKLLTGQGCKKDEACLARDCAMDRFAALKEKMGGGAQ